MSWTRRSSPSRTRFSVFRVCRSSGFTAAAVSSPVGHAEHIGVSPKGLGQLHNPWAAYSYVPPAELKLSRVFRPE